MTNVPIQSRPLDGYVYKGKQYSLEIIQGLDPRSNDHGNTEISVAVSNFGSVFDSTLTAWLDEQPPGNWADLDELDDSHELFKAKVKDGDYVASYVKGIPDGQHVLYVDVNHDPDEKWNGHIVVDDDTLSGVALTRDTKLDQLVVIEFITKNGIVTSSSSGTISDKKITPLDRIKGLFAVDRIGGISLNVTNVTLVALAIGGVALLAYAVKHKDRLNEGVRI